METQPEPIADIAAKLMLGTATEHEKQTLAIWMTAKTGRDILVSEWLEPECLKQEYEHAYPSLDTMERLRLRLHARCNHSIY